MLKKILSLSIAAFSFFILLPAAFAHEYKDVPQGSAYYYPVDYLRRNDVFKDTAYFYPDALISKAEFIKYLVILNSPEFQPGSTATLPFEDTRDNAWYATYFKEAIKLGILDDREKKVEPDKKLTMIDALTLLFHSQSIPIPNVYHGFIPYTDVARNTQAAPLIMRALSLDIIYPQRSDYVGIYQRVTRAQAARMIYKMDLVTLGSAYSNGLPQISTHTPELDKLISVWELIESSYLNRDSLNKEAFTDSVLKELVNKLDDPYSVYMNTQENMNFQDSLDGELEGIGAVIGFNESDEITIVSPLKGSPAEKAGLKPKDIVVEVDGDPIRDLSLEEVVSLIKGPSGSTVKIKVKRSSSYQIFIIERAVITMPSLEYEVIEGGKVMLINFGQFNYDCAEEFQLAMNAMMADSGIKGLIIDLRGNPGGLLDQATSILGHFIEAQQEVVTIDYMDFTQVLLSRGPAELKGFPVVVLIDEGSASASEIVAGALQDYGLATIVGQTSFGKGTVQEVNYFLDNSSLKLTVAEWLTPDHTSIQDGGIKPDVTALDDPSTDKDEALSTAVSELYKLIR